MAQIHLLHSGREVQLMNRDVKDGQIILEHRIFTVDKSKPFIKRKMLGKGSMYILHWASQVPVNIKGIENSRKLDNTELCEIWDRNVIGFVSRSVQFFGTAEQVMKFVMYVGGGAVLYVAVRSFGVF